MIPRMRCPQCNQRSLRWWRVASSSSAQPALCSECRALVHQSTLGYWISGVGAHLAFFGGIIAAFALESAWGLLLFPLGFAAATACGLAFPLRISTESERQAAQQRANWFGRITLLLAALWLLYILSRLVWPRW